MTDDDDDNFRERNREHAKKSRVRKKVMLETYSDQLAMLRMENTNLRRVVTEKMPPHLAGRVLHECTTCESTLLSNTHTDEGECIMLGTSSSAKQQPRQVSLLLCCFIMFDHHFQH
jgi:type VI protein secretion system component VasF